MLYARFKYLCVKDINPHDYVEMNEKIKLHEIYSICTFSSIINGNEYVSDMHSITDLKYNYIGIIHTSELKRCFVLYKIYLRDKKIEEICKK